MGPLPDIWLAAGIADLTPDLQVYLSWGLITLCNPSLSAASMSSWASQAHAFHQPVSQRLSWLHHWSVPHVHTIGVFSPSEWGPDPQCQAAQKKSSSLDLVVTMSCGLILPKLIFVLFLLETCCRDTSNEYAQHVLEKKNPFLKLWNCTH